MPADGKRDTVSKGSASGHTQEPNPGFAMPADSGFTDVKRDCGGETRELPVQATGGRCVLFVGRQ
jgi:hypothetical protein